jgi:hypothetical protein
MNSAILDGVLNKISLNFGNESLELIIPHDTVVQLSMYQVASIDTSDLDNELIFQSKLYALFSALLSYVTEKSNQFHSTAKRQNAIKSLEYEKQLLAAGERATDKKINNLVETDEVYKAAIDQDIEYENMVDSFKNILKSLEVKRDSLLQLVIKRRQEENRNV